MKRRLGSVTVRKDGRVQIRVTRKDGRRITRYIPKETENALVVAEKELARLISEEIESDFSPEKITLSQLLTEYLQRKERSCRFSTLSMYSQAIGFLERSKLAKMTISTIRPRDVQHWVDAQEHEKALPKKALMLLKAALNEAVSLSLLRSNPASTIKWPRVEQKRIKQAWTFEEAKQFLAVVQEELYGQLFALTLLTGARIGEIQALKLTDYNSERKTLNIERTTTARAGGGRHTVGKPKTPSSKRIILLSEEAAKCIEKQLIKREQMKCDAGEFWSEEHWLFPDPKGRIICKRSVLYYWHRILKKNGIRRIRIHDLRVTFISLCMQRGAKPEVVAKIVGHASPMMTLSIYRDVYEEEMQEARDVLSGLFL